MSRDPNSKGIAVGVVGMLVLLVGWYTENSGFVGAGGIFVMVSLVMLVAKR